MAARMAGTFASVGNLKRNARFAQRFPLLAPRFVKGAFRVIGRRFGARKFDYVHPAPIPHLVALGLQPDVLDPWNFPRHLPDAVDGLFLIVLGGGVAEFVSD